ncbi:hypothetical protein [uncultured Marivita sp.]|nr:hypothetical protein [uncultured Marivita sp.]
MRVILREFYPPVNPGRFTVTEQIADAVHAVLYDPAETSAYG